MSWYEGRLTLVINPAGCADPLEAKIKATAVAAELKRLIKKSAVSEDIANFDPQSLILIYRGDKPRKGVKRD